MPSLTVFKGFTTRPFAGDDLQIVCLILGFFRFIQFLCLFPFMAILYSIRMNGKDVYINGIPPWCPQFKDFNITFPLFDGVPVNEFNSDLVVDDVYSNDYGAFFASFIAWAVFYFGADVAWICITWSIASIGTPTEPMKRDKYLRILIMVKMFVSNVLPCLLLINGVAVVHYLRLNNYGCGNVDNINEPIKYPDEEVWFLFFSVLLITFALELFVWPAIVMNFIIKVFRKIRFLDRSRVEGKAARFEYKFGILLKVIQYLTCNKAGGTELRNTGELNEFAKNVMRLMNNDTKLDLVLSDIYVGMCMLSRVQAEERVEIIKNIKMKDKNLRERLERDSIDNASSSPIESNFPEDLKRNALEDEENCIVLPISHPRNEIQSNGFRNRRRDTLLVLNQNHISEHELLLESNVSDALMMKDAAHFVKYASYIYLKLRNTVVENFLAGSEGSCFTRPLDTLFRRDFNLTDIGLEKTFLCYMNLVNGIIATPYAILVDDEVKKVVLVVRGTRSLEDLVMDLQYIPFSLEKVGNVCGFEGKGHWCHQGFLTRSKWIFNDIKKNRTLQTLYSDQSPFKDFPLVFCGHSLGAGVASILALMLRSKFPSLKCFAYEVPGCIFDEDLCKETEEYIISFVRNDDLVPRLSHHNFETVREKFCNILARIKVPKIKLFLDLRIPSEDKYLAHRNAKILMPEKDIRRDTQFFQRVEKLKLERFEKNLAGVNKFQLFIPGKIIHLVDTKGNNSSKDYVPYYAHRKDFNQVLISKRMLSDHDIHFLIDIFRDTRLVGPHSNAASLINHDIRQILKKDNEIDVNEPDIRLFFCCSNPNGKLPLILASIASLAWALGAYGSSGCDFLTFHSIFVDLPLGLYSYALMECTQLDANNTCVSTEISELCYTYPPNYEGSPQLQASRIFAATGKIFGVLAVTLLWVSTCVIIKRRSWILACVILLLTSLFQGLVLILFRDSDCLDSNDLDDDFFTSSCSMNTGAIITIVSTCLWFAVAVGAIRLARMANVGRTSK